jgi:tRNA(Ile)-lysidine synthase|nr:MAG: tRNA(Ile)-lysidine synthase [Bacteroidota bacterium]
MPERSDPLARKLRQAVLRYRLWEAGDPLLVAVSGGMDSVVLLHLLRFGGLDNPLFVGHVDHALRPDSALDAEHVQALCRAWQVPCVVRRLDVPRERQRGESLEAAARRLRYGALEEMARSLGARWIVTAHHLEDQAETVVLNLLRGAGLWGLRGIGRRQGIVVRPLLDISREEIRRYAERHGLRWREDPTNRDERFRRNAIRHQLWPFLRRLMGTRPERPLARLAELAGELLEDLQPQWQRLLEEATLEQTPTGRALEIPRLERYLGSARRAVLYEALRSLGAPVDMGTLDRVLALCGRPTGRRVLLRGGWVAWRDRNRLWIGRSEAIDPEQELEVREGQAEVLTPDGRLSLHRLPQAPPQWPSDPRRAYLDADLLRYPLRLRRWRAGDRFQPLGMGGTKKVSDLLTDMRLSGPARRRVWVLESAGQIAWVVGWRIDHRFRVQEPNRPCVELIWEPLRAASDERTGPAGTDLV